MNFSSHYLWEKGLGMECNTASVVLQQVEYEKRQILFACVCTSDLDGHDGVEESGYFSERMTEWFYKRYLKQYGKVSDVDKAAGDMLQEQDMILKELRRVHKKKERKLGANYCVILLQGSQFVMLQRGKCKILLINKRYNIPQIKIWEQFDEKGLCIGKVQKNLGILLCSERFAATVVQENYRDALLMEKKTEDSRLGKRLKEVWQGMETESREEATGAVYIRTY